MEIKGDRRGLRCLATGFQSEHALLEDLAQTLNQKKSFLGQANLGIEVDGLPLTGTLMAGVAAVFQQCPSLTLTGIHARGHEPRSLNALPPVSGHAGALVVPSNLRSGQVIEHAGDIVILGDVNPGALVKGGANIYVLGRLRGMVLAGQPDGIQAGVYALAFEPSQVRIAHVVAVPAGEPGLHPECAHVEQDRIVVAPWKKAPDGMGPGRLLPKRVRNRIRVMAGH